MSPYKRVLIKISGESFSGSNGFGFHKSSVDLIIEQIKSAVNLDTKVGVVVGGGNFFRGHQGRNFYLSKINADYVGMMATVMNAILLKDALQSIDIKCIIRSSFGIHGIVKEYNRDDVLQSLDQGYVVIFAGGTGNPCFTTDSCAALRAIEMNANLLIKATKVDGVYDKDPVKYKDAKKYESISYKDAIINDVEVMDHTALLLCRDHGLDINVCSIFKPDSITRVVGGYNEGSFIKHITQ